MIRLSSLLQFLRRTHARYVGVHLARPRYLAAQIDWRMRDLFTNQSGVIDVAAGAWIETGTVLHAYSGSIKIGQNVFLGPHVVIYGHGGVEIGDSSLIAMHCCIVSSNHTVPAVGVEVRSQPDILRPTKIGRDVWLGAGVTVLGGVTIGDGCVVGAGSVVTKNLPPGAIAFGNPAVVKGHREGAVKPL